MLKEVKVPKAKALAATNPTHILSESSSDVEIQFEKINEEAAQNAKNSRTLTRQMTNTVDDVKALLIFLC
jgi:hypothetical protein